MAHFDDPRYSPSMPVDIRRDPLALILVLISGVAWLMAFIDLALPHFWN